MKILILMFFLPFLSGHTQNLEKSFETFLSQDQVKNASISFLLKNLSTQNNAISYNQKLALNPASLQKIITTSTALDILGKDFQFVTEVQFNGEVTDNVFKGIIDIKSCGDPTLDEKLINDIYIELSSRNIKKMEGYITVDESGFSNDFPKSWLIEDIANYYGTPSYGFNFMKNTYKLAFQQANESKKPKLLYSKPYMRNLTFYNQISSGTKTSGDQAYILGVPFSNERTIVGSIPSGTGIFFIKGAMNNPSQVFKNLLIKKFQKEQFGFVFNPNITSTETLFYIENKSKRLEEIITETNQKSVNLYAESLLKKMAETRLKKGSTSNGIQVLEEHNELDESVVLYDGSGLSRKNLVSASFLSKILGKQKDNSSFKNSLGVSGVSGTMKYFKSETTKNRIYAKSGSADGILNYAGYFKNNKGEQFSFVLLINNYAGKRKDLRKKIVTFFDQLIQ